MQTNQICAPPSSPDVQVVLVQSGAYNPVHLSHVEMFSLVRRALLERHSIKVVGGFLAPSGDSYVKSKLGDDFIAATHRIEVNYYGSYYVIIIDWLFRFPF